MRAAHHVTTAVLAALFVGGCASGGSDPGSGGTPTLTPRPASPSGEPTVTDQPTPRDRQTAQAVEDLAQRLSVSTEEIRVVSAEEVTWPDGSLGCPKKDRMYTMALVEGRRIVLEAAGKRYAYHAGGDKPPFYCEHPRPAASGNG